MGISLEFFKKKGLGMDFLRKLQLYYLSKFLLSGTPEVITFAILQLKQLTIRKGIPFENLIN